MLRFASLLILVAALAVVSGCGGSKVSADEVPGPPVALTVPEVTKGGSDALAGNSNSSSSSSTSADATPTPTATTTGQSNTTAPSTSTGTTQSGTSTNGTTGGTQQTQQNNTTNNTQSQNGGQQPFDDFCKNNPGAC
jgi:hypothetical protein